MFEKDKQRYQRELKEYNKVNKIKATSNTSKKSSSKASSTSASKAKAPSTPSSKKKSQGKGSSSLKIEMPDTGSVCSFLFSFQNFDSKAKIALFRRKFRTPRWSIYCPVFGSSKRLAKLPLSGG